MADAGSQKSIDEEIETALLDAELFVKYKSTGRAVERLQKAVAQHPRSVQLREKLREVALMNRQPDEAARQCLALASLYLAREDFDAAHERLLLAKQIDPRINITTGLEAVRRARRPELQHVVPHALNVPQSSEQTRRATLAGDLSAVSIFDAVQVIENARLTGALSIEGEAGAGRLLFNGGSIIGAETEGADALEAFQKILEITSGYFDFEKSEQEFPITIQSSSNTSLILDSLRAIDEAKS